MIGMRLNNRNILLEEIEDLDHWITPVGLQLTPNEVKVIAETPAPVNG